MPGNIRSQAQSCRTPNSRTGIANLTHFAHAARCLAAAAASQILAGAPAHAQDHRPPRYDYPTAARADYVVGCLAANGFQHTRLDACACNIDVIANYLSYDEYEQADAIMSMQQASVGPRGGLFRDTPVARQTMEHLNRAQAEALLRCD